MLYSHISVCPMSPCFLRPFLSLLPFCLLFLKLFSPSLFSCLYNFLTVPRGCFTPIGVIHLSFLASLALLSLSFLFLLSFFSSFLFLSSLSSFSHSLSLQMFGAAAAAMPHRFRRAWANVMLDCFSADMNLDVGLYRYSRSMFLQITRVNENYSGTQASTHLNS